jgi:hypothetical protein
MAILIFVISYLIIGLLVTCICAKVVDEMFLEFPIVIIGVLSWPYVLVTTIYEKLRYK